MTTGWTAGSYLEINTYILARVATASVSLDSVGPDSMDMDEPGLPSLDSFIYRAGAPVLSAVGPDLHLSTLEGPSLPATLLTCSYAFAEGRRVRMRSVLTYIEESRRTEDALTPEHSTITLKVSKRQRYGDDWLTSSAIPQQRSGNYRMNADGHFHRFEINIPAGTDWQHAHGWDAGLRADDWPMKTLDARSRSVPEIAEVVHLLSRNRSGEVTLTPRATITTVTDPTVTPDSVIDLDPLTASAAAELYAGQCMCCRSIVYSAASRSRTHLNAGTTDRSFRWLAAGD